MPKRRWLSDELNEELESLTEEELDKALDLLRNMGFIPEVAAGRYVQNGCIRWDGVRREISFRVDVINHEPKFIDKELCINKNVLMKAGNIVAQEYGLEIGKGSAVFIHSHVGASDAYDGKPQYYHKSYFYIQFRCPLDSMETFLAGVAEKIRRINDVAWRAAAKDAKDKIRIEAEITAAENRRIAKIVSDVKSS